MSVETFARGPLGNNIYLVIDHAASVFVAIDPSMESAPALQRAQELQKSGLTLQAIWNTHGHFDHIFDNHLWKTTFNVPLFMHEADLLFVERLREQAMWFGFEAPEPVLPDHFLAGGQNLSLGKHEVQVLYTPGHSPGSVSFYFEGSEFCVSGDVIFRGSAGRFDLPGASASELAASVRLLTELPAPTRLLPGHAGETTVAREKKTNPACLDPASFFGLN